METKIFLVKAIDGDEDIFLVKAIVCLMREREREGGCKILEVKRCGSREQRELSPFYRSAYVAVVM